jgi:hypothetical protein
VSVLHQPRMQPSRRVRDWPTANLGPQLHLLSASRTCTIPKSSWTGIFSRRDRPLLGNRGKRIVKWFEISSQLKGCTHRPKSSVVGCCRKNRQLASEGKGLICIVQLNIRRDQNVGPFVSRMGSVIPYKNRVPPFAMSKISMSRGMAPSRPSQNAQGARRIDGTPS